MGLSYFREKIVECRQKQDRVNDLLLDINQYKTGLRRALTSSQAERQLLLDSKSETTQLDSKLKQLEGLVSEVRWVLEVIEAKRSNLRMTSSDIRLLCSIVDQQIKSGEVKPGSYVGSSNIQETALLPGKPVDPNNPQDVSEIDDILNK